VAPRNLEATRGFSKLVLLASNPHGRTEVQVQPKAVSSVPKFGIGPLSYCILGAIQTCKCALQLRRFIWDIIE
jgi:hypothetical protein